MVPINFANREIILTASIGLVSFVDQQENASGMLSDAELAMYRAKRAGGNRVEPFQPGLPRLRRRPAAAGIGPSPRAWSARNSRWSTSRSAGLEDVEIAGFEALMRWEHPKRGNIPPSEFIPIAEASDIISHARYRSRSSRRRTT